MGFGIGSLVCIIKPSLHLLSIPGYMEDGASWVTLFRLLYSRMTPLDWGLIVVGAGGLVLALWPERDREARLGTDRDDVPPYRKSTTWMDKPEAHLVIRGSSLVGDLPDMHIPWTKSEGLKRMRAYHIVSRHLGDFEQQCPDAVRDGKYGRETLYWWVGKKIEEREIIIE